MRTEEKILADVDSSILTNQRVNLEIWLDIRELLIDILSKIKKIKEISSDAQGEDK